MKKKTKKLADVLGWEHKGRVSGEMGTSSVIRSVPNNDPTTHEQLLTAHQLAARFGARLRSLLPATG